jgi:hypothetical protein
VRLNDRAETCFDSDMDRSALNVRFVPLATIRPQQFAALFDDLVGAGKQRGRHSEAKCFGKR